METVALYGRVSTQEQANEGYSLQEQEKRLRAYADSRDWAVGACYMDGGFSGAKMERPGLQNLIDDVKHHRVSRVIVYKLDRLSRSQKDTLYLIEDVFLANEVDFISLSETLDTSTPFGIAMIGILSVFAQLERETIRERMWTGIEASVRAGNLGCGAGGMVPVGYDRVDSRFVINPYEAMIVRQVFERYANRECVSDIWRDMDRRFPLRGSPWSAWRVSEIIRQPLYVGLQRWHGELVPCTNVPQIVDRDLWDRAQALRSSRNRSVRPQSNHRHVCLLGGIIFCGVCGARMSRMAVASRGKKYTYYACGNRRPAKDCNERIRCSLPHVKEADLDNRVIEEIRKLSVDGNVFCLPNMPADTSSTRREDIQKEIDSIKRKQKRLMALYASDAIDFDSVTEMLEPLTAQLKALTEEERNLTDIKKPSVQSFLDGIQRFNALLRDSDDIMTLYPVVHELISDIVVTPNDVKINWNL